MFKKLAMAVILVGALLGIARAGYQAASYSNTVSINTTNRTAQGALGHARNTTDTAQYIGCHTWTTTNNGTNYGSCWARDVSGNYVSCISYSAAFLAGMQSVGTDSWVYFASDAYGNCTSLDVETTSQLAPKQLAAGGTL